MGIAVMKLRLAGMFLFLIGLASLTSDASAGQFGQGDGSKADPFVIATAEELLLVSANLDSHFTLKTDIDLSGVTFKPIGSFSSQNGEADLSGAFRGSINGCGYAIRNMTIANADGIGLGLFAATDGAEIRNLRFESANISAKEFAAAAVGYAKDTLIQNVAAGNADSPVVLAGGDSLAGIAGKLDGKSVVDNCRAWVAIEAEEGLGGIAGFVGPDAAVRNSVSRGGIKGTGHIGGLAGRVYGLIQYCRSETDVALEGTDHDAGGLAGTLFNAAIIEGSHASGKITGAVNVGGLVARCIVYYPEGVAVPQPAPTPRISGSSASGAVRGFAHVGGLIGHAREKTIVENCHATGAVELFEDEELQKAVGSPDGGNHGGGLAGKAEGGTEITGCWAAGDVSGAEGVAGLVGFLGTGSSVAASRAYGDVTGEGHIGALTGRTYGLVSRCEAYGNVVLVGDDHDASGLAGTLFNGGAVRDSSAFGVVTGHENVAGVVGRIVTYYPKDVTPPEPANIAEVTGNVFSGVLRGDRNVGGIVGNATANAVISGNRCAGSDVAVAAQGDNVTVEKNEANGVILP